ncbi:MAG: hypothetical protein B7Z80_16905 [Rhodospirillales bacterium 20-64-7]|nr:MAG: hypothetical protein B7Z80_16905 [Rhodospirillales bacterium 20-64-7]
MTVDHSIMGHRQDLLDLTVAVRQLETHLPTELTNGSRHSIMPSGLDLPVVRCIGQHLFSCTDTTTTISIWIISLELISVPTELGHIAIQ